uniref:Uncharacterized protein n=1 Tax=Arundo donax TaxID=35708 RepID=A0A0A9B067_ARUDO
MFAMLFNVYLTRPIASTIQTLQNCGCVLHGPNAVN